MDKGLPPLPLRPRKKVPNLSRMDEDEEDTRVREEPPPTPPFSNLSSPIGSHRHRDLDRSILPQPYAVPYLNNSSSTVLPHSPSKSVHPSTPSTLTPHSSTVAYPSTLAGSTSDRPKRRGLWALRHSPSTESVHTVSSERPTAPRLRMSKGPGSTSASGTSLLALGKGLSRMGSVMRKNSAPSAFSPTDKEQEQKFYPPLAPQVEADEGDAGVSRPFNVEHDLHVSPDLEGMPPAWLGMLKAQGLSESDLLLIASARRRQQATVMIPLGLDTTPTKATRNRIPPPLEIPRSGHPFTLAEPVSPFTQPSTLPTLGETAITTSPASAQPSPAQPHTPTTAGQDSISPISPQEARRLSDQLRGFREIRFSDGATWAADLLGAWDEEEPDCERLERIVPAKETETTPSRPMTPPRDPATSAVSPDFRPNFPRSPPPPPKSRTAPSTPQHLQVEEPSLERKSSDSFGVHYSPPSVQVAQQRDRSDSIEEMDTPVPNRIYHDDDEDDDASDHSSFQGEHDAAVDEILDRDIAMRHSLSSSFSSDKRPSVPGTLSPPFEPTCLSSYPPPFLPPRRSDPRISLPASAAGSHASSVFPSRSSSPFGTYDTSPPPLPTGWTFPDRDSGSISSGGALVTPSPPLATLGLGDDPDPRASTLSVLSSESSLHSGSMHHHEVEATVLKAYTRVLRNVKEEADGTDDALDALHLAAEKVALTQRDG